MANLDLPKHQITNISRLINKKTSRYDDNSVIENLKKSHRDWMESPAKTRPSMYCSKKRGMLNSARNWHSNNLDESPNI